MSEQCRKINSYPLEVGNLSVVGVLAIQGDFLEHRNMLSNIGVDSIEIRLPRQLDDVDGLIIPGGESTSIVQMIDIYQFRSSMIDHINQGMPVWGTCAGMITIAGTLTDKRPEPLGLMDTEVTRNAFGRQVNSFEENVSIEGLQGSTFRCIFIRAPKFEKIGQNVKTLGKLKDGTPIIVQEKLMLATSFHPELTEDTRIHELFCQIVEDNK